MDDIIEEISFFVYPALGRISKNTYHTHFLQNEIPVR